MKCFTYITMALAIVTAAHLAEARTVRATELNNSTWADIRSGAQEFTIEFRERDELPVNFVAEGDLLATTSSTPSYIVVKRNFWIKIVKDDVLLSTDGTLFKPLKDSISGSFSAGAGQNPNDGIANAIQLSFKAFLK